MPKYTDARNMPDMWRASETEEEDFGDDTGEWPVDGIVSEEIDLMGVSRCEVRWKNWHRKDGTNTTWTKQIPDRPDLIEDWKRYQANKRRKQAQESLDIVLEPLNILDAHNIRTAKRSQAIEDKIDRSQSRDLSAYANWDSIETTSGSSRSSRRSTSTTIRVEDEPIIRRTKSETVQVEDSYPDPAHLSTPVPYLKNKWNKAAKEVGAAGISITNDIDDEEEPPVVEDFHYLENTYSLPDDIAKGIEDSGFLLCCTCKVCKDVASCDCQRLSELVDENGEKFCAYTVEGLFNFRVPPGVEVIECNQKCECSVHQRCYNRVAQKPRNVHIDIFKTRNRGWGARATVNVPQGKVLGIYTGRVLHRDELEHLPPEHKGYTFNLDAREGREDDAPLEKYTVDAYTHGNWTRFINHSCAPNVQVYPVVWDTVPEKNIPYLAFVAIVDIPAYSELLLDYDPAFVPQQTAKGKKKQTPPSDTAIPCYCGSPNCRGWLQY